MAWVRHQSMSRLTSVEQNFVLQKGQTALLVFTPVLEDAAYTVDLEFDKTQRQSLDCYAIQSSNIEWTIVRDEKTIQAGTLTNSDVMCNETDGTIKVSLWASNLILNHQHSLNLSIADEKQQDMKLQSRVSVKPFGIAVHYAWTDVAIQELFLGALLIVGFGCFLPDVYRLVFYSLFRNPDV
jgi:hypothetical protein